MLYYSLLMRHRQAVRQGTLTPPSQVRLLLAQLHKRPARKLRFSKSCRSFCVQKQEWGTASEPSPLEKHLAGVAFSCISRVTPVVTIGVWMPRNCPPQITLSYPTNIIALLFIFVKNFFSTKITIISFIINFKKGYNRVFITNRVL